MSEGSDINVGSIEEDIKILENLIVTLPNFHLGGSESIRNILQDYKRQKQINEEHQKINGELREKVKELEGERKRVLDLIFEYGQIDGGHHKMWVIDQIVRILTKDKYNEWIKDYVYDEETGDIYSWDKGIAP